MKRPVLLMSATALFLVVGGGSIAQQQQEITDGMCPVSKATLCWTDGNGEKTCKTQITYEECGDSGSGGDPGGDPGGPTP